MYDVVAYCRFSSDNQRSESIDAQMRAIKEYCKKNGYNLIKIYKDEAISGTSIKDREAFLEMIKDSKKQEFQFVVVHKFDRFARNRYDHAIYEKKLEDNGVKLLSVLEQLNNTPEAVILKSVLTGMNEYYSLNLSREVKKGQKENALKCLYNGGNVPLGYDINENKEYILNEKEAEIVKKIFDLYLNGYGYASIADTLNKAGLKNKQGKPFRKTSIRDFFFNEKYTGTFVYGKKDRHGKLTGDEIKIENGIPKIIEPEVFERVKSKLINRRTGSRASAVETYYLTGLCYCGICGGRYSGGYRSVNRDKSVSYGYLCMNRKTKINDCKNKPIEKSKLENLVFDTLKKNLFTGKNIKTIANNIYEKVLERDKATNKELREIEKEIEKLTNKSINLLNKNLDGKLDDTVFNAMNEKINNELLEMKRKKAVLNKPANYSKESILKYLKMLKDNLHKKEIKASLINAFVERVEIYPDSVKLLIRHIPSDMDNHGGDDGT